VEVGDPDAWPQSSEAGRLGEHGGDDLVAFEGDSAAVAESLLEDRGDEVVHRDVVVREDDGGAFVQVLLQRFLRHDVADAGSWPVIGRRALEGSGVGELRAGQDHIGAVPMAL